MEDNETVPATAVTTTPGDILTVAQRAWTERGADARQPKTTNGRGGKGGKRKHKEPTWPETALMFGTYRYCRWAADRQLVCVEEGLFYADDLPERDPIGHTKLSEYANAHAAEVSGDVDASLRLRSRREFIREVFFPVAWETRGLVVGFNLPFDLSRLAVEWGEARKGYAGGFSLVLGEYQDKESGAWREHPFRPRVCVKSIDSKRALIGFTQPHGNDKQGEHTNTFRGRFLDLRTLAFALSDKGHSLDSACQAFGVENGKASTSTHGTITPAYIDYARQDTAATVALLVALREEFDWHPVDLDPCRTYSPASLAKGYLRAMDTTPPLTRWPDFPRERLGQAMSAFYGGRAEVRIRRTPVPLTYVDFRSMYPTVNSLLGSWSILTAERVEVVDATAEMRALLAAATPEAVLNPAFWRGLMGYAEIVPRGDIVPVRAAYDGDGGEYGIGVNPLHDTAPHWYALPDLVMSALLTGRPPDVQRAWRLVPHGSVAGLRLVALRGSVTIDPLCDDFFRTVIEERLRLKGRADLPTGERERLAQTLKTLANSGAYGIFAEFTRQDLPKDKPVMLPVASGNRQFEHRTSGPEYPGEYCFPPLAACVTAAARLLLGLLERLVADAGGHYAFCDTDSLAIVSSKKGGLVPCPGGTLRTPDGEDAIHVLSWDEVDAIVQSLAVLNPYDRSIVPGSILKVEDENYDDGGQRRELWGYAISAKRYALFTRDANNALQLHKCLEHGLGQYLEPIDPGAKQDDTNEHVRWTREAWTWLIRHALVEGESVPLANDGPLWLDRPAVVRITASSPALLKPLARDGTLSYRDRIKPFNFLLTVPIRDGLGYPVDANPQRFRLVHAYDRAAHKWERWRWLNIYDGEKYGVTTRDEIGGQRTARVSTYRDVLTEYRVHPERKSTNADGLPCNRATVGRLGRRPVRVGPTVVVGKEANRIEDVDAGIIGLWDEVRAVYDDGTMAFWRRMVLPQLREVKAAILAGASGISIRAVKAIRNGDVLPRAAVRATLAHTVAVIREGSETQPLGE